MGPTWAAQMGSMSIWPRAPCQPQMGSPRMSLHGLSMGPTWAAHYGLPVWAPRGQPRWARCQFGHGLHVSPKWAAHELAYMGLLSAPSRQPIRVASMGPMRATQMGSMSIWPRAPCQPQMGSPRMSLHGPFDPICIPHGQSKWALLCKTFYDDIFIHN